MQAVCLVCDLSIMNVVNNMDMNSTTSIFGGINM